LIQLINIYNTIEVALMFKNTYQSGFLSILYSIGSKPLQIWDKQSTLRFIQFTTDISKDWLIKIFSHPCLKLWGQMWQLHLLHVLKI